jgi:N-carbamoylputrescine amidase
MASNTLSLAMISDVFFGPGARERLRDRLVEARSAGASLAVLPEIATLPWAPATTNARDEDAEEPGGPLHVMQAELAREVGIGVLGSLIVREADGTRFNTCLLLDATGTLLYTYRKIHIPQEPGFWESSHYEADTTPPRPVEAFGVSMGVQICSDVNRPTGSYLLAAQGAQCILAPRSTELATWWKWRPVLIANALTSCAYVLTVNRPAPEDGVLIGGPSFAVAPTGEILAESTDPVVVVEIDTGLVDKARSDYPGYLAAPSDLYARGWSGIPAKAAHEPPRG